MKRLFILFVLSIFMFTAAGKWFTKISSFEVYARKITGAIFILAGLYYVLIYFTRII